MDMKHGYFLLSIDLGLYWSASDQYRLDDFEREYPDCRKLIKQVLKLTSKMDIKATWAVVGLLMAKDREEVLHVAPRHLPRYQRYLKAEFHDHRIPGENEQDSPFTYGLSLVKKIQSEPGQEIGSLTFSHFNSESPDANKETLWADLQTAVFLAQKHELYIKTMSFPDDHYNLDMLNSCLGLGIKCVRGRPREKAVYALQDVLDTKPLALPVSRYLKPYSSFNFVSRRIDSFKIKREMTQAAKEGKIYHLAIRDFEFSNPLKRNLKQLKGLLSHYETLKKQYQWQNASLGEVADLYGPKN